MAMQTLDPPAEVTSVGVIEAHVLTAGERRHLVALEKRIERGLQTFKEVGAALQEVRDSRLYRDAHPSFEAYCQDRWGLERQRAYQLIGAVEVVHALPENAGQLIRNEATARELVTVMRDDPEDLQEVWAKVVERAESEGGKVTAETVRQVKAQVLPPRVDIGPSLAQRLLGEATRMRAVYAQWVATGPDRKTKRNVDSAIRAITQA